MNNKINKVELYKDFRICDLFQLFLFKQLYTLRVYDIPNHKYIFDGPMENVIEEDCFTAKIFFTNFWLDKRKNPVVDIYINPIQEINFIPNLGQ